MNKLKSTFTILAVILSLMSISISKNPILLVLSYLIHELGHLFFAHLVGAKMNKIRGGVFRLLLSYEPYTVSYLSEILICSGGIIFNLIASLVIFLVNTSNSDTLSTLLLLNLSLAIMNLYPVSILDGGNILRTLIFWKISGDVAEKLHKWISFFFAILMWLLSVYVQIIFSTNISLLFISIFLLIQLCFSI